MRISHHCFKRTCDSKAKFSVRTDSDDMTPKGSCGRHISSLLEDMVFDHGTETSLLIFVIS